MNERQKRLNEVYEHLRRYFGIHTKTGFAEAIHYGRTSLSAAMNGDESYLTDNLFKNICEAYRGVFNLEYLLNGTGDLLTIEEEVSTEQLEKLFNQQKEIDQSSLVNAALAAKDETIALLRGQIEILQSTVATKNEMIELLQRQIEDLRHQLSILREQETLKDFPFSTRASEPRSEPRK